MPKGIRWGTAFLLGSLWTAATLVAQQPAITTAEIDQIKKDVTAAVEKYYRLFSEQNMKALPAEVFNTPWIQMTGNGPQPNLTAEQSLAGFEASLKQLVGNGWGKSIYTTTNVCVLNRAAAITSGYNTRYKQDGSVMSVGGVAYVFAKAKDGWRIVSYTGTASKDTVVKCD